MRGRLLATVVGVALAAGATACGGGKAAVTPVAAVDATTTTSTAGSAGVGAGDAGAAYMACLRDHGVDVADRQRPADAAGTPPSSRPATPPSSRPAGSRPSTSLPAGVDQARLAAARDACQTLQPTDRGPMNGPPSQAFQVYASCMKDHGVTVAGAIRDDPAFKAADAICGVLRPAPTTTP